MTPRLSLQTAARLGPRPVPDPRGLTPGIVHLGVGAFHRAHQATFIADCLASGDDDWGVLGFTQRSRRVVDQLAPQDCLFTVLERSADATNARVVGLLTGIACAADHPDRVVDAIADGRTRVVTLTVTEKGYRHDPATGHLRLADPVVRGDLAGAPPATVVGQLVRGLDRRRRTDSGPVSVLCCDNLPVNGRTLAQLVDEFCAAATDVDGLSDWLQDHVTFPSCVVDRIVPATTPADIEDVCRLLGVHDEAVVATEPFRHWVIEDRFAAGHPGWDRSGVVMCEDVTPYENIKLRVLNAVHSALAYLGALADIALVSEAVAHDVLRGYVRKLVEVDVTPTLDEDANLDAAAYLDHVLERFANPALRHTTVQVAMDGTQKLPQRLLRTIALRRQAGAEPLFATFAVAAWMRFVWARASDSGRPLAVDDPLADRIADCLHHASDPAAAVDGLLSLRAVFPAELADDAALRRLLVGHLAAITAVGAVAAARELLDLNRSSRATSAR